MELTLEQLKAIADKLDFKPHHNISAVKLSEQLTAHAEEYGTTLEEVSLSLGYITKEPSLESSEINDNGKSDTNPTSISDLEKSLLPEGAEPKHIVTSPVLDLEVERLKKLSFEQVETAQSTSCERVRTKEAMRLVRVQISCNNKAKAAYPGEIFSVRNAMIPEVKKFVQFNAPTHIPRILLNMLKERKCQVYKKIKDKYGNETSQAYLIPEYNIQELPPLSKGELEAIKKKQIAEGYTGESDG